MYVGMTFFFAFGLIVAPGFFGGATFGLMRPSILLSSEAYRGRWRSTVVIRIGPAGWSYRDWEGVVYPVPRPKGLHEATFLAEHFDTIEINSTFYRRPEPWVSKNWARRVAGNPRFRFTAKLFRGFTHERNASADDELQFKEGIAPLAEAERLGALLLQFPWSCKNDEGNRGYLFDLLRRFRDYPLVLEVRRASWNQQAILDMLAELGIGLCNIDQPLFAVHQAGCGGNFAGRVHPPPWPQLPTVVYGKPADWRPLQLPVFAR
jgi:uncharacterized protein YecE (DUF72 family)